MTAAPELLAQHDVCRRLNDACIPCMLTASLAICLQGNDVEPLEPVMNDTSPKIEAFLKTRFAAMTGSQRIETALPIVVSSLGPSFSQRQKQRALCRRFDGDELAPAVFF